MVKKTVSRGTIADTCRKMICEGYSNEEILAALKRKFGRRNFGGHKRYYPSWYRCELRRKGELPPAFDTVRKDQSAVHKFED